MIRTWGHATSEQFADEPQRSSYGVFQFFEHTLVVLVRADASADRQQAHVLTQLVVRLIYDQFQGRKGEPDAAVITKVLSLPHDKVVGLRSRLNLTAVGMEVTVTSFGSESTSEVVMAVRPVNVSVASSSIV